VKFAVQDPPDRSGNSRTDEGAEMGNRERVVTRDGGGNAAATIAGVVALIVVGLLLFLFLGNGGSGGRGSSTVGTRTSRSRRPVDDARLNVLRPPLPAVVPFPRQPTTSCWAASGEPRRVPSGRSSSRRERRRPQLAGRLHEPSRDRQKRRWKAAVAPGSTWWSAHRTRPFR
jgi:hypothetical protein